MIKQQNLMTPYQKMQPTIDAKTFLHQITFSG
jgi:hypothetical protein